MADVTVDAKGKELKDVSPQMRDAVSKGNNVVVKNADKLAGLGAGFRTGKIRVEGDAYDYVGAVNAGAEINISGKAHNFLGDNMTTGKITCAGDTGYGAGMYCYGGQLFVKGGAGDFTATMNKGATIVIGGNVGNEVGTYMTNGDLIILGNAGKSLGNFIIRGTIYLKGKAESYGNNVKEEPMTKDEMDRIGAILKAEGYNANPKDLKKLVPISNKPFYHPKKSIYDEEGWS